MPPFILPTTDFHVALRNILRQPRRSAIAMLAICFGVIAMMLAAGFIEWIFWANREGVTVNQLGHIQLVKPGYLDGGQADPYGYLLPAESTALEAVQQLPEVQAISPRLTFTGLISHGDSTLSFLGEGIDPAQDPSSRYLLIVQGKRLHASDPRGVLLGEGLAANLGVRTGDTIVLLASTRSGGINAVEGKVRGLASTTMKAYDDSMLRVPLTMARELLRVTGAHVWIVTLRQTEMTSTVVEHLKSEPKVAPFDVVPWTRLADFYNKTVELFSRQIHVLRLIIGAIIVLSITNTMSMNVAERTGEIGTAMALGVTRPRILLLFLLEGTLLGAIGGFIGVAMGYIAANVISAVGIPMPPAPGMSRGFSAGILVTPAIIGQAWLLAVGTTLLASAYPAWRASRLIIVDALRHNR